MYNRLKHKKNVLASCLGLVCVIPQSYGTYGMQPALSQKVFAFQSCRTITSIQVKGNRQQSRPLSLKNTTTRNKFPLKSLHHGAEETNRIDVSKVSDLSTLNAFLLGALQAGDETRLKELLDAGANIEVRDYNGLTPLIRAASQGQHSIVETLLSHGANPNVCDLKHQLTPLHLAARSGDIATVKILLEEGADANIPNKYKITPLILAAQHSHEKIVEVLLQNGADANPVNNKSDSYALHWAASNGDINIMNLLRTHGADVNAADKDGIRALHYATVNNQKEAVQFLLQHGAQVDAREKNGLTPLDCAQFQGYMEIIQILQDATS